MPVTGKHNALTDVEGIAVGHHTADAAASGVTVILCGDGAVAGVDVRGAAPGTRETDLLAPENLVETVQAILLSGGSVYGLVAADGVVRWLEKRHLGFPLEQDQVAPIVPAAVLYDLGRGDGFIPPVTADWGVSACEAASDGPVKSGCLGAGTGAVSGSLKGGVGTASVILEEGITVAALFAVNSYGSVVDPQSGEIWESRLELDGEWGKQARRRVRLPEAPAGAPARNTTIGVVATNASLSKVQCKKIAQMAHDGMARAIRPAHTMFDGDTIFCLSTRKKTISATGGLFAVAHAQTLNLIGDAAALCTARAIIKAVVSANSRYGATSFSDLQDV